MPGEASAAITPDVAPQSIAARLAVTYPEAEEDEAVPSDDEDVATVESEDDETEEAASRPVPGETAEEGERRRRRRRRRRGGRREDVPAGEAPRRPEPVAAEATATPIGETAADGDEDDGPDGEATPGEVSGGAGDVAEDGTQRPRRRGRRGGRRRRREPGEDVLPAVAALDAEQPDLLSPPAYRGPTPADPFGGQSFDIFDVMDQAEREAESPVVADTHVETVMVEMVVAVPEPSAVEPAPEPEPEPSAQAPVMAEPAAAELAHATPAHAEPVQTELAMPNATEPSVAMPANDVVPEPAIRPIVIGSAEAPAGEKKRGWWRR